MADTDQIEVKTATVGCDGGGGAMGHPMVYLKIGGEGEIVVLRDFHDLSYSDIAQVLDIPIGTVMSRLHGPRRQLRARLEGGRHA